MNNLTSPKQEFASVKENVTKHRRLIDLPEFETAIKTAQLQYTRTLTGLTPTAMDSPNQLQASAMCFQRIQGMNDFIAVLLGLGEAPKLPPARNDDNLKH